MPQRSNSRRHRLVDDEKSIVRTSLARFVLLSLLALVVLGTGLELVSRQVARGEAIRDARTRSAGVANGIAAPLVNAAVRRGDPAAVARLAKAQSDRMRDGSFTHILMYDRAGRVLWSDATSLIGRRFRLSPQLRASFGTSGIVSALPGDEDRHAERIAGGSKLLEVYVATRDADGEPFLFEAYIPPDRIDVDRRAILQQILPVGLGGLLLFQLAVLPLAFSLARRVDHARRQQSDLLRRSLLSWHEERRRLAHELHDGVIQDLSAASYALPSLVKMLPADPSADAARSTGERIGTLLQQDLQAMRSLIFDLLPADLDGLGLATALEALARRHREGGLAVHLEVATDLGVDSEVAGLVFRVVREGLRNVDRHARASSAWVRVVRRDDHVEIELSDDGHGLRVAMQDDQRHFGVRLLEGLVADVGGTLSLRDRPEGGAVLEVRVPAALPD
ncbi:MAG: histidine kinase [Marmoricola sp.]